MRTEKPPAGWEHLSDELVTEVEARGFKPVRGIYGIMVYDPLGGDKFYFTPSGHFIRYYYEEGMPHALHGHAGSTQIRQELTDWMDLRA